MLPSLSDEQLADLRRIMSPLGPRDRDQFLELVVSRLRGRTEIGGGEFWRLLASAQRECGFQYPISTTPLKPPRRSLAERTDAAAKKLVGARWFRD